MMHLPIGFENEKTPTYTVESICSATFTELDIEMTLNTVYHMTSSLEVK